MTQKDKKLLLRDLSARLPYGVIVQYPNIFRPSEIIKRRLEEISYSLIGIDEYKININGDGIDIEYVKPYLRPMSSMTEEEKREYNSFIKGQQPFDSDFSVYPIEHKFVYEFDTKNYIDWMNKHHFDYRGLIEKGLALEELEGMYDIKNK